MPRTISTTAGKHPRSPKKAEMSQHRKEPALPRAMKVCAKPGCPEPTYKRHCTQHAREADKARGTSTQRGYGTSHIDARKALAPQVATGTVRCARCGEYIQPGAEWQLDHSDTDRTQYKGPSHKFCNLSAAGKKAHQHG